LHNQKLPHDQGKALFSQKLRKFIAKQSVIAKTAMYANNYKSRAKSIESNHIYKAWQ
jgi:hypothetical protein